MYNHNYMVKNTLEIGEKRVNESLELISRFGWFSSVELGKYFWGKSTKEIRNISLSQLLKKLVENNLVALRQLPGKNGKALVLLTAGVRYLTKMNISATNGKDIGSFDDFGNWNPPRNWQHDLLTQRYLMAHLILGRKFMTELELRKSKVETKSLISRSTRYPDGLIFVKDQIIAVETESASKTGPKRDAMVLNIVNTYHGNATSFNGHTPGHVVVLADEKSHIDHKKNIINALTNVIDEDIKFYFALYSKNKFKDERVSVKYDELKKIVYELRYLQYDQDGEIKYEFDYNQSKFYIELSKYKKINDWKVFDGDKLLQSDSSAESFLKVKEDIAVAILNNSRQ